MQKIAHVLALLTAWFMWQKIGGLFLAALAIGFIEVLFVALLGLLAAPFVSPPLASPDASTSPQLPQRPGQEP